MLSLIGCELYKLRRRRLFTLLALAALLFPVPLAAIVCAPRFAAEYDGPQRLFDAYYTFVMGDSLTLLLPCMLGAVAAMLFFMERDNDTFKSLRAIPVTATQMILAKVAVLFLAGVAFALASTLAAVLCGAATGGVNGVPRKLLLSAQMGAMIAAGALPLVVLIVFFSRTMIFSVLLCVFHSVLSLTAESLFGVLPLLACRLMPIPLTTLWGAGEMVRLGIKEPVGALAALIPTTAQAAAILLAEALASVALIDLIYRKRGEA